MTQNNSDPAEGNLGPDKSGKPGDAQTPPKKKKRRWVLKSLLALVVLIVLLVLLAPTILSLGVVRESVVSSINGNLNGKLAIKDWSFGWTSGVHIDGVELTDANNAHLLSVASIDTPISFLKAATGTIDLGDATIKGVDFNAVIDRKGEINLANVSKPSNKPASAAPSGGPSKLPNVKGTIHLQGVTGTVQDDADGVVLALPSQTPLNVTVGIADINQPITDAIDLGLQVDNKNLVQVKVNGTVSAIQSNQVDVDHLAADQTVELAQGDLAALTQVLHALKLDLNVTGKLDGKIEAKVATLKNISADGGITLADVSAGGGLLSGDAVAYQKIQVNLGAAIAPAAVKVDLPITMTPTNSTQADQVSVHVDAPQDSLMGTVGVFQEIVAHLAKTPAGGVEKAQIAGAGDVKISADVNVAGLAAQLPHTLHLEQGTSLTSGRLTHETTITLANGQAVIATKTELKDFGGTNGGTAVKLQDVTASAGVTAVGGDHPDVRDVSVSLASPFANAGGGGATLGKLKFQGSSDLKSLQQQIGQFVDLDSAFHATAGSHVSLVGTIGFDAHTDGDLTADDSMIGVGANLNATGVAIDIPGRRAIDEPKLAAMFGANLHHTSAQFVEAAKDVTVSVNSPAIDFAAGGDAELGGTFGVSGTITRGKIDLRLLQEEFGGALSMFVASPPAGQPETLVQRIADNSVRVATGSITLAGKGRFDQSGFGFEQPLAITVQPTDLTVADEMGTVQTLHVPVISLGISGNGTANDQHQEVVKNLALTTMVGTSDSPLLDVEAGADLTVATGPVTDAGGGTMSAQRIELSKLDGDLARLQSAFGPLLSLVVPATPGGGQKSVVEMISQNLLVCTSGKLSGSMLASCDGKTMTISKPLTVTISDLTLQQQNSTPISNETIAASVGGTLQMNSQTVHATVNQLSVQLGDQLALAGNPASPIDVTVDAAGKFGGSGEIDLKQADLAKLVAMGAVILPPAQMASLKQLTSGVASGTFSLSQSGSANKVTADLAVNSLTIGQALNNEKVHLTAGATLLGDMTAVNDLNVGVDTSFAKKVSVSNGQIVLATWQGQTLEPVGMFDMLRSVNVEVQDLDLAKVDAILNVLSAPPPPPPGAQVVLQVPPPVVTSGTASLSMDVSRSANTTTAKVSNVLVHELAMKSNGNLTTWPHDVTANLSADVQTTPNATAQMPISQQLVQAEVTSLAVDSGIGTTVGLIENKPIVASNLGDSSKMLVQGGVEIDGDVASAARVAETFGGAKPNTYPYAGHFHFDEAIAKQASEPVLHVNGGGEIKQFVVMGQAGTPTAGQVVFSEDDVSVKNPLDFDLDSFTVAIAKSNPVAVVLNSSGALGVNVSGTIQDVLLKRQIADDNPVALQLSYDLAKLWPIVKPMLSASTQQTLADLQISGKQTRSFTVSGSYPADKQFNDAVAMLKANGSVTVDSVSTQGISIQSLTVPVYLNGGVVQTTDASGALAQPASCNGGTIDLGGIQVDLRSMLLSMPRANQQSPQYVLKDVSINPAMSQSVMGKFLNNPAFVNAHQAQGLLTARIVNASQLPISNLSDASPQNKGTAVVIYSVRGLQIGSELLAVFGNDNFNADINDATVKYAMGRVAEDTTMMINQQDPLRFVGTVVLATEQFAPMTVYIPPSLFRRVIPANVQQYVPNQVVVPMKGDMNHPQIDLAAAIAETVKQGAGKAIINGLLQGLQRGH